MASPPLRSGNLQIRMSPELHTKLAARAFELGISINQLVIQYLEASIRNEE